MECSKGINCIVVSYRKEGQICTDVHILNDTNTEGFTVDYDIQSITRPFTEIKEEDTITVKYGGKMYKYVKQNVIKLIELENAIVM